MAGYLQLFRTSESLNYYTSILKIKEVIFLSDITTTTTKQNRIPHCPLL
jgi:hypothetical protein